MSFVPHHPPTAKPKSTGIMLSRTNSPRRGDLVTLSFRPDLQEHLFGGSIAGRRIEVLIGRGDDEGLLLLRALAEGRQLDRVAHVGRVLPRGGGKIELRPWNLLGDHVAKSMPCRLEDIGERGAVIRLPDWCQPAARKARVASRIDGGLSVRQPEGA